MEVGNLRAKISAQIDDYEKGLAQAAKSAEDFGKTAQDAGGKAEKGFIDVEKASKVLKTSVIALTGAMVGAAGALVGLGMKGMKSADENAKLARQLGYTNEELATLQRAGEFAGISTSQLTTSLERMNVNLGRAGEEGDKTSRTLERLGIETDAFIRMRPDEKMRELSAALQGVEDRTEQAMIAQELFGRSGQQMLLFLDDAEETLERANVQVNAFGLALNEVETDRIERANDALSSIGAVIRGIAQRIAAQFAPLLEAIALRFEQAAIDSNGFGSVVDRVFNFVIGAAKVVANAIEGIGRAFVAIRYAVRVMQNAIITVFNAVVQAIARFVDGAIEMLNKLLRQANRVAGIFGREIEEMGLASESSFVASMQRMADNSAEAVIDARDRMDERFSRPWPSEVIEDYVSSLYEAEQATERTYNKIAELTEEFTEDQKEAAEDLSDFMKMTWHQQTAHITEELAGLTRGLDKENRAQFEVMKAGAISQAIVNAYRGISNSLGAYPWPLAGIMAAAHAAAGWAQVSNIRSQQYGSGGGATAPPRPSTEQPFEQTRQSVVNIALHGETFQRGDVRSLIEEINDAVEDGARIRVS